MAISLVSAAHKEFLRMPKTFPSDGGHLERFYLDFRQRPRPPLDETLPTFTVIAAADNRPGSHNMTGGRADYLMPLTQPCTIRVYVKPTFAYTVATDQVIWSWYIDATRHLTLAYSATLDKYVLTWQDGGTARTLEQVTAYTSDVSLQVWTTIDVAFASSSPALGINGVLDDGIWSGLPDTKVSAFPKFSLRHRNGTEGAYSINHVRMFPDLNLGGVIANDFKAVYSEEVYWPLDGHAVGRTRCNVTDKVKKYTLTRDAEKEETGYCSANSLQLRLNNRQGVFSDDQYAAFDPANRVYNGTSSEKFLQQRCGVIAESWYGSTFDTIFVGRLTERLFKRKTFLTSSEVTIEAEDMAADAAKAEAPATTYENKKLADGTPADSAIHLVTRRATDARVEQFLANGSFENATIGNSWLVSGTGATLTRGSGGLLGSYRAELAYGSATAAFEQLITFTGNTALNVGEKYTFSIWLFLSIASGDVTLTLSEEDSGGVNGQTSNPVTVTNAGWTQFSVTRTVLDSASDRLRVKVSLATSATLCADLAMLHRGGDPVAWFVLNSADGVAGVFSADSMVEASYQTHGFDVDAVNVTHPWLMVDLPWDALQDLADATVAFVLGYDAAGTMRLRTPMKTGFSDPAPMNTIDSTWDVATEIDDQQTNSVRVAGVRYIKDTTPREVYNAWDSKDSGLVMKQIANGGYYPDPTTHRDFWASYEDIVVTTKRTREWWQWHSRKKTIRTKRNEKDEEIVGLKSPSVAIAATDRFKFFGGTPVTLTQVAFDTTSYADKCKVLWRNDTGDYAWVWGFTVRGMLVKRLSGTKGIVHDKFVDHDAIRRNGAQKYEIENNLLVDADQVKKVATYVWKDAKKHTYSIPLPGAFGLCLEPGDWQTLQIGASGHNENINSTVRVMKVVVERQCDSIGTTKVTLREVQQNFVHDSTAWTRTLASGRYDGGRTDAVVVASSTYMGPADFYCIGSSDEDVLNASAELAVQTGRKLVLTPGTFYIDGTWQIPSGLAVEGAGDLTVIRSTGSSDIVLFQSGGTGISVRMLKLENGESVNYSKLAVNFNGATKCLLQSCAILFAAGMGVRCDGDFNKLIDNRLEGGRPTPSYSLQDAKIVHSGESYYHRVTRLSDDLAVYAYYDVGAGGIQARILSTLGDAIQVRSEQAIDLSGTYTTVGGLDRLDDTHFVITMSNGTTTLVARVCTVGIDDETITPGTAATLTTAGYGGSVAALTSSLFVAGFRQSAAPTRAQAIACTVSGTTITVGTATDLNAGTCQALTDIAAVNATQFAATYLLAADWGLYVGAGSVSGTTITAGNGVLVYDGTTSATDGKVTKLVGVDKIIVTGGSIAGFGGAASAYCGTVSAGNVIALDTTNGAQFSATTNLYTLNAIDASHFVVGYVDNGTSSRIRIGKVFGTSVVFEDYYEYINAGSGKYVELCSSLGRLLALYTAGTDVTAKLIQATVAPDAFVVSGNGNLVQGSHILGLASYRQEVGIYAEGDDNSFADNTVDGLAGGNRLIDTGVYVVSGNRNSFSGNRVLNCLSRGVVNQAVNTLLDGTNTAFNNGAETGVETF